MLMTFYIISLGRSLHERGTVFWKKTKKQNKNESFSSRLLHTSSNLKKYLFCCKNDNYSNQCQVVTDNNNYCEILEWNQRCFKCLKPGHLKPNYKKDVKNVQKKVVNTQHYVIQYLRTIMDHVLWCHMSCEKWHQSLNSDSQQLIHKWKRKTNMCHTSITWQRITKNIYYRE